MCGIFGIVNKPSTDLVTKALTLSESRGKDASGVCTVTDSEIKVLKSPLGVKDFVRSQEYRAFAKSFGEASIVIGHARMETNGSYSKGFNNQPVIKDGIVTIHNGIIVNDKALWETNSFLHRDYEVDTEIINTLIRHYLTAGEQLQPAVEKALGQLQGAYSVAVVFEDYNYLVLASNTGSLYTYTPDGSDNLAMFASERGFLQALIPEVTEHARIKQVTPGSIALYPLPTANRTVKLVSDMTDKLQPRKVYTSEADIAATIKLIDREYATNKQKIQNLKRCTRCLLPETIPYITFDDEGVCSFCKDSKTITYKGEQALEQLATSYSKHNGMPDVLVPFSGGRDSSYGLYYMKNKLGLTPVTFTYDWGMITDLARRNIARMCGQLGVENILISADIRKKRENVRKNVMAWSKKPCLGTVPLFMAGDKQFFYYVNKLKRDYNIKLNVWMANRLEETNFKSGFCGIKPDFNKKYIESLATVNKIKLAMFYAKNFVANPAYLNASLLDTAWAFFSYYFEPRNDFYLLYDFIPWNEQEIENTLITKFDWETSPDTKCTWRIGDGTASFYNYIYYTMAGFTENDTFRSTQIRQGILTREEGMVKIEEENKPRIESLMWYCNTAEVPFKYVIEQINAASKLY